jgi:putative hydrolases of HD superfamily
MAKITLRQMRILVRFLKEISKLKSIGRRVLITNKKRWESSTEHSWELAMWVWILAPYLPTNFNIQRTTKMVLMHDLVEIYAGDTFFFDHRGHKTKKIREDKAAKRLFSQAPKEVGKELVKLWKEFEICKTKEAKIAKSIDRLQPILQNILTDGVSWRKHKITEEFLHAHKKEHMQHDPFLSDLYDTLIKEAKRGKLL